MKDDFSQCKTKGDVRTVGNALIAAFRKELRQAAIESGACYRRHLVQPKAKAMEARFGERLDRVIDQLQDDFDRLVDQL